MKILIADGLGARGKERLQDSGKIELIDAKGIERDDLKKQLETVDILIVRSRTKVDAELLEFGKQLKLVIRAGIGLDNVDVTTATQRGVVVMNAPTGNIVTTAEHAIALLFSAARKVPQANMSLRSGKWEKSKFQGTELCGKTLGVVGLGNIGKTVAKRALGLKMKVIASDPYVSKESAAEQNIQLGSLDDVLAKADFLSLHLPLVESTKHLINTEAFQKMKDGAYLIHCARGGIVDESALLAALESGKLSGCALDVFETEPVPADHPLLQRDDVVVTPHLGASTSEAQDQVGLEVADEILQYVESGALMNAVNVPNVSLEQLTILKPFLTLCERLGAFAAQAGAQNVKRIRVRYRGEIGKKPQEVLTLSVLKGFLSPILFSAVNFVNVRGLLKERGIRVEEAFEQECPDFNDLVEVEVEGDETVSCSGTLFGREEPRIVRVDRFDVEGAPQGVVLYTKNDDQPGVIGSMGSILGQAGVNINRMALGFDRSKGQAIALINVDKALEDATLENLRKTKGMVGVTQIKL